MNTVTLMQNMQLLKQFQIDSHDRKGWRAICDFTYCTTWNREPFVLQPACLQAWWVWRLPIWQRATEDRQQMWMDFVWYDRNQGWGCTCMVSGASPSRARGASTGSDPHSSTAFRWTTSSVRVCSGLERRPWTLRAPSLLFTRASANAFISLLTKYCEPRMKSSRGRSCWKKFKPWSWQGLCLFY